MKRSLNRLAVLGTAVGTLVASTPAFAQDSFGGEDAAAGVFCGVYACIGVFALLSLVFWIWMLVDLFARQEYEFPGSTGNSKTTWMIVMFAS